MTLAEARMLYELRRNHRYTQCRLAEVFYPKDHPAHGQQMEGVELLRVAIKKLGITWDDMDPEIQMVIDDIAKDTYADLVSNDEDEDEQTNDD